MEPESAKNEAIWDPDHDWILQFEKLLDPRKKSNPNKRGETQFLKFFLTKLGVASNFVRFANLSYSGTSLGSGSQAQAQSLQFLITT